jgi:hypothetical protein
MARQTLSLSVNTGSSPVAPPNFCIRGEADYHEELVRAARADRAKQGYDVANSVVQCLRCLQRLPLG